jgi:CheY-like chemotaxis protein
MEAGRLNLDPIDFNLRQSLHEMLKPLALRAQQKGLNLSCRVSEDVPEMLLGDLGRVRQVLINLVGNAIKFTHEGTVAIAVFRNEEARGESCDSCAESQPSLLLRFAVSDTGVGIALDKHRTIFEPFLQADGSTTRKFGGTGLGLAISSRLVEMMSGRLGVESEQGIGSTFHFTARFGVPTACPDPRGALMEQSQAHISSAIPIDERRGLHVLVAEDNVVNQKLAVRLLEKRGYRTKVVETGREALTVLEAEAVDIVLMDVQMPEMDGLEATILIRELEMLSGRHIPIIAITAHAMKGDRERCLKAGMDGYVSKPIDAPVLFAEMDRLLSRGDTDLSSRVRVAGEPARAEVFNRTAALARVDGDTELLSQMVSIFIDFWPRTVTEIYRAIRCEDSQALERAAHSLKGAAASIGATATSHTAARLEKIGRDGDLIHAGVVCDSLEAELECLRPLLAEFVEGPNDCSVITNGNDDARH